MASPDSVHSEHIPARLSQQDYVAHELSGNSVRSSSIGLFGSKIEEIILTGRLIKLHNNNNKLHQVLSERLNQGG
jgi:hypothetical protein